MGKWDLEEMLSDEAVKAKLVEWAVAAALAYPKVPGREAALRGCNLVTSIWRQTIVRPVIDRLNHRGY
jgi:hypothetical protein